MNFYFEIKNNKFYLFDENITITNDIHFNNNSILIINQLFLEDLKHLN